jgi:hypothetical protein
MRRCVAARWLLLSFASIASANILGRMALADDIPCSFAVGEVWTVRSGSGAKVVIGRVEEWRGETAVHVAITDVKIPVGYPGAGTVTEIADAPFQCASLKGSVEALVGTGVEPPQGFEDGYRQWRDARGGIFTTSVSDVIALMLTKRPGN